MKDYSCHSSEHDITRRRMLGGLAGGTGAFVGLGNLLRPAVAEEIKKKQKQVLLVWTDGGMSQYESWYPKPGTEFGGPMRAIPTSVDGIQFSELLEHTAKQAHHLAVIRSMSTFDENHSTGVPRILRGDPPNRGVNYPHFGSAISSFIHRPENQLPPYVHIKPYNSGFHYKDAGFLDPKWGALALGEGKPPENIHMGEELTGDVIEARNELRVQHNKRFAMRRRRSSIDAHAQAYNMAAQLMDNVDLFDDKGLSEKDKGRYGHTQLGRHLLQARRLLEAGTTFVRVTSYHWDTHADNFNAHMQLMPQFDKAFASIIEDLDERGMLEHTLVIAMCEFGRTPKINFKLGRDHWPGSWSMAVAGCGINKGITIGETDPRGIEVTSDPYDVGHLYYTLFQALGLNPKAKYSHKGQSLHAINPECYDTIKGLLA